MKSTLVQPLGDRILLELESEDRIGKVGNIYIPDAAQERPMQMRVVMLGNDGGKAGFAVKEGDLVLCSKYGGTSVKYDEKEYIIHKQDDIMAIIKE